LTKIYVMMQPLLLTDRKAASAPHQNTSIPHERRFI